MEFTETMIIRKGKSNVTLKPAYVAKPKISETFADDTINTTNDGADLWLSAKRELAERTREYIKENPISEELQAFIDDLRKPKRRKRQDHSNMYAIKNGEVVPLQKLEEHLSQSEENNLGENFTVVPLIIPINLENTMTLKEHIHEATEEFKTEWHSERAILGRGDALLAAKGKFRPNKADKDEESGTEETVINNLIDEKLKSTVGGTELNKVLEDVQNLISAQKKGRSTNKEGVLCNVTGHWDSKSGGMTFHIKNTESGAAISMRPTEPPSDDGFIIQDKWNVSARIPFTQSAQVVITLTAHKGRRVAIFLGECRICDGSETITGDWLMGRTSSNCKDQKASHAFISDVFRKNNVEALREAHMRKISTLTSPGTTTDIL